MVIHVGRKFVVAVKNADRFKQKTLLAGQACRVEQSDGGFCLVVHGAVELGFSGKEMVVSPFVLVSLDMPVVLGERQVGTIDHDVLQYVRMPAAGWDPMRMSGVVILLLRLGVDMHHGQVAIGDLLAMRVFGDGLHILNICCS
jgi:hypothetical protein